MKMPLSEGRYIVLDHPSIVPEETTFEDDLEDFVRITPQENLIVITGIWRRKK